MSKRKRRNHAPAFKAKGTRAAVTGEKTLAELAQQFDVQPNQITTWKAQLVDGAAASTARFVSFGNPLMLLQNRQVSAKSAASTIQGLGCTRSMLADPPDQCPGRMASRNSPCGFEDERSRFPVTHSPWPGAAHRTAEFGREPLHSTEPSMHFHRLISP